MKLWLLLAFWLALALSTWARSQSLEGASLEGASLEGITVPAGLLACTSGPYGAVGAPSCLGPSCIQSTVSNLTSIINSAINGAVICLQRGEIFSATTGLNLTASHPDQNRVTICASTGTTCTDSGGANPRISITSTAGGVNQSTGKCVYLPQGVGGYTFKNMDCFNTSGGSVDSAWWIEDATSNVSIEGGVIDSFWRAIGGRATNGVIPNNFRIGTCANRTEIRGTAGVNGLRTATFFACTNCGMSVWIHGFAGNDPANAADQNHMVDQAHDGNLSPTTGGHDFTLECSLLQYDVVGGRMGSFVKLPRGYNMTVQDNTFDAIVTPNGGMAVAFNDHGAGGTEGVDGAVVRRNYFHGPYGAVMIGIGRNIDIYNNVGDFTQDTSQSRGLVQFWYNTGSADDTTIDGIRIFNNTVYRTGNSPDDATGWTTLVSANSGGAAGAGRTKCTTCELRNDIVVDTDTNAKPFGLSLGCGEFGPNGANVKNVFTYTPNDGTPLIGLVTGCSGDSGNTTSGFTTNDPHFANPSGHVFTIDAAGRAPCGFGVATQPVDDYALTARAGTSSAPFDVGAFRCPP